MELIITISTPYKIFVEIHPTSDKPPTNDLIFPITPKVFNILFVIMHKGIL